MTYSEAVVILSRVRAGDKSPTSLQINQALVLTGDLEGVNLQLAD
jgi:hypothetical protein